MSKKTAAMMMTSAMVTTGRASSGASNKGADDGARRVLVAYYSWSGNTRYVAEQIQKLTGGELLEIRPVQPYPPNFHACVAQAQKELDTGFRPQLRGMPQNLDDYDVIFIGSPNWWHTIAPPLTAFLSAYNLTGKMVVPFITHGGGGMQNCERDVGRQCGKATVLKAAAFSDRGIRDLDAEIAAWIEEQLGIRQAEVAPRQGEEILPGTVSGLRGSSGLARSSGPGMYRDGHAVM